jgi:predicted lipid-binding transport protein (Tim44 family)
MPRRAPSAICAAPWIRPLVGLAVGSLIGSLLLGGARHGAEDGSVRLMDLVVIGLVFVLIITRRRQAAVARPTPATTDVWRVVGTPPVAATKALGSADLERGVGEIRRTDPGFDATRFSGYTGMMFRDAQTAWMTRDIAALRPRVSPEIYGELQAQCDRLRSRHQSNRVEDVEISTEITEAWQENGRDYVTAYIAGSMVDYTVDDANDAVVAGSKTHPRDVEEFWTFTRPAGLNFWMLSAIQPS